MDASVATRRLDPARPGISARIWDAARIEFSSRGYHGARVQGIARGAACNVALMYRHWASKRALYLDILRSVFLAISSGVVARLDGDVAGPAPVVGAFLDAMMGDPMGAQILIREYLDGAPFLSQLAASDPALMDPIRRIAAALEARVGGGVDPLLAVVTVGGVAALVSSAREAARPFAGNALPLDAWKGHVQALLVNGLAGPAGARHG